MTPTQQQAATELFLTPQRLNRAIGAARDRFIASGLPPKPPVRSEIISAWQRSAQLGIRPRTDRAPTVSNTERWCRTQVAGEFGLVSVEALNAYQSMLEGTGCVLVIAERHGNIFHVIGDVSTRRALEDINFMAGGMWAEEVVGPNGVGTALRAEHPSYVFGNEHFCDGWQPWACFGSPVRNPESGDILGVIDLTCKTSQARLEHLALVTAIARNVENVLQTRELKRREYLFPIFHLRARRANSDALILLSRSGRIVLTNDLARTIVGRGTLQEKLLLPMLPDSLQRAIRGLQINTHAPVECNLHHGPVEGVCMQPIRDESGALAGYLVILRNVAKNLSAGLDGNEHQYPDNSLRATTDEIIRRTLAECHGDISLTARKLGVARSTLYRRMKKNAVDDQMNAATPDDSSSADRGEIHWSAQTIERQNSAR